MNRTKPILWQQPERTQDNSKKSRTMKKPGTIISITPTVALTAAMAVLFFSVRIAGVEGESMKNILSNGDTVIVENILYPTPRPRQHCGCRKRRYRLR